MSLHKQLSNQTGLNLISWLRKKKRECFDESLRGFRISFNGWNSEVIYFSKFDSSEAKCVLTERTALPRNNDSCFPDSHENCLFFFGPVFCFFLTVKM